MFDVVGATTRMGSEPIGGEILGQIFFMVQIGGKMHEPEDDVKTE